MPDSWAQQAQDAIEALGGSPTADDARRVTDRYDDTDVEAALASLVAAAGGGGSQPQLYAVCRADDEIDVATGGLDPLSNGGTIDGVTLTEGMKVLLMGQGNAAFGDDSELQNTIWNASVGPWTRDASMAVGATFDPGTPVTIVSGNQYQETLVYLMNDDDLTLPFTVGTDDVNYMGNVDLQVIMRGATPPWLPIIGRGLQFSSGKLRGPIVSIGNSPPDPIDTLTTLLQFDTTATTGGLYAWDGSQYQKVGLATS